MDLANIGGKAGQQLGAFGEMIQEVTQMIPYLTVTELTKEVLDRSGYLEDLKIQNTLEAQARIENLEEFLTVTQEFDKQFEQQNEEDADAPEEKLTVFLNDLALVSDIDNLEEDASQVTLMTLHAAKGLEFPVVFLIGLEEGFSFISSIDGRKRTGGRTPSRICGITRAEEALYLTNAFSRTLYGRTQYNRPSRFVEEIDQELLEIEGMRPTPKNACIR